MGVPSDPRQHPLPPTNTLRIAKGPGGCGGAGLFGGGGGEVVGGSEVGTEGGSGWHLGAAGLPQGLELPEPSSLLQLLLQLPLSLVFLQGRGGRGGALHLL